MNKQPTSSSEGSGNSAKVTFSKGAGQYRKGGRGRKLNQIETNYDVPISDYEKNYDKPLLVEPEVNEPKGIPNVPVPPSITPLTDYERNYDIPTTIETPAVDVLDISTPVPSVVTPQDEVGTLDTALTDARTAHLNKNAEYNKANREKEGRFRKVLTDLGIQNSKVDRGVAATHASEVASREETYNEAYKARITKQLELLAPSWAATYDALTTKAGTQENYVRGEQMKFVLDACEQENIAKATAEINARPEKERGRFAKTILGAWKGWSHTPKFVRYSLVAAASTGIALAAGVFATTGLIGAAGYGGYRLAKSGVVGSLSPFLYRGINKVGESVADNKKNNRVSGITEAYKNIFSVADLLKVQTEFDEMMKKNKRAKRISKIVALTTTTALVGGVGMATVSIPDSFGTGITDNFNKLIGVSTNNPPSINIPGTTYESSGVLRNTIFDKGNGLPESNPSLTKPEIDSEIIRAGGNTEATMKNILAKDPSKFGYDATTSKIPLDKWLNTRVANILVAQPELAKLDLVHAGDTVFLTPGTNGSLPKLGFENSSGLKAGTLPIHPIITDTYRTPISIQPEPFHNTPVSTIAPEASVIDTGPATKAYFGSSGFFGFGPKSVIDGSAQFNRIANMRASVFLHTDNNPTFDNLPKQIQTNANGLLYDARKSGISNLAMEKMTMREVLLGVINKK
jgi:hypothetical protein